MNHEANNSKANANLGIYQTVYLYKRLFSIITSNRQRNRLISFRHSDSFRKYEDNGLIERMPNSNRSIRIVEQGITLRPEVQWFAEQMEKQLQRHEDRGGWKECDNGCLIDEVFIKANNLLNDLNFTDSEKSIKEAANVANFAMMIADNARGEK